MRVNQGAGHRNSAASHDRTSSRAVGSASAHAPRRGTRPNSRPWGINAILARTAGRLSSSIASRTALAAGWLSNAVAARTASRAAWFVVPDAPLAPPAPPPPPPAPAPCAIAPELSASAATNESAKIVARDILDSMLEIERHSRAPPKGGALAAWTVRADEYLRRKSASAIERKHRQNVEPNLWFLCRESDRSTRKSPAKAAGLSLRRWSLPVRRQTQQETPSREVGSVLNIRHEPDGALSWTQPYLKSVPAWRSRGGRSTSPDSRWRAC